MSAAMKKLGELAKGMTGVIARTEGPVDVRRRLLEMGFLEGSTVELVHEAPFGGDPIAVKVRGSLLALRRSEANLIEVTDVRSSARGGRP